MRFSIRYNHKLPEAWMHIITLTLRLLVGGLFIFSGFLKGVDIWGTFYKISDYISVLGFPLWKDFLLVITFLLCAAEFALGVFLLLGAFRRWMPIFATIFMAFMLPFSAWIMIANPVSDCGCFGDAFIISNSATFYKNVALTVAIIWLLIYNTKTKALVTPALQWIVFLASGIYIFFIAWIGYAAQPIIDFRPFPVGSSLVADEQGDDDSNNIIFVYEKDGKTQNFSISDSLPSEDDGWTYVKSIKQNKDTSSDNTLYLWDEDGNDVSDIAIDSDGKELILFVSNPKEMTAASSWLINSLYDRCNDIGIDMIMVMASDDKGVSIWRDISMAEYDIYTAEDTQIKEVVRGNPGVVYLDKGKVVWKSTLNALDNDFLNPDLMTNDISRLPFSLDKIFKTSTMLYILIIALLIFFSFTHYGLSFYIKLNNKKSQSIKSDDKALHEE